MSMDINTPPPHSQLPRDEGRALCRMQTQNWDTATDLHDTDTSELR